MSIVTNGARFAYAMNTANGTFSTTNQPLKAMHIGQAIYESLDTEGRINGKDGLVGIEKITVFVPEVFYKGRKQI